MDAIQSLLFGETPRRVGTPQQHWVWSPDQIDFFIDQVNGRRNVYATLARLDLAGGSVCDKVLYDLDSPQKTEKHEPGDWKIDELEALDDDQIFARLRNDDELAERVLGPVCADARRLAERSRNDNVPIVGVYTGYGIHIHQLFQPKPSPEVAMSTTHYRYVDVCDLETWDPKVVGQPDRICRIPNCQRVTTPGPRGVVKDGRPCNIWTIPLTAAELASVDVDWLLDRSHSPREIDVPAASERPEMRVWEDHRTGNETEGPVPPRPFTGEKPDFDDDGIRDLLRDLLQMPCMVERLVDDPNPAQEIRVNATVLLLNLGLHPQTIVNLFEKVNWIDFDRETTEYHVMNIYRNGYSDMSCSTLRSRGWCTRAEEPEACPTYGWSGGKPEWKQ